LEGGGWWFLMVVLCSNSRATYIAGTLILSTPEGNTGIRAIEV
jgi:hypothetical protein